MNLRACICHEYQLIERYRRRHVFTSELKNRLLTQFSWLARTYTHPKNLMHIELISVLCTSVQVQLLHCHIGRWLPASENSTFHARFITLKFVNVIMYDYPTWKHIIFDAQTRKATTSKTYTQLKLTKWIQAPITIRYDIINRKLNIHQRCALLRAQRGISFSFFLISKSFAALLIKNCFGVIAANILLCNVCYVSILKGTIFFSF